MRLAALASSCLVLALGACATEYSLSPVGGGPAAVRFDRGQALLVSRDTAGSVRVAPVGSTFNDRMVFAVVALNTGGAPANLGYENVSVTVDGRPLRMHTFEELQRDAQVKASWRKFSVSLAGGLQAAQNERAAHSYATGAVYSGRYSAGFYAETYNPAVAARLDRETAGDMAQGYAAIDDALGRTLAELDEKVLRTTTIDPGASDGGLIAVDGPDLSRAPVRRVDISVRFNGEEHTFAFYAARPGAAVPAMLPSTFASNSDRTATPSPATAWTARRQDVATGSIAYADVLKQGATRAIGPSGQDVRWYPAPTAGSSEPSRASSIVVTTTGSVLYSDN